MKNNAFLEVVSGTSKKGNDYKMVKVTCGDFQGIVSNVDKIHMMYLEQYLGVNKTDDEEY